MVCDEGKLVFDEARLRVFLFSHLIFPDQIQILILKIDIAHTKIHIKDINRHTRQIITGISYTK
jgi:hypothetical protein